MKKIVSSEKSVVHKLTTVLVVISLSFVMLTSSAGAVPYAYIDGNHNNVSIIDTANNNVTDTIDVGFHPMGVAVNQAGTKVYLIGNGIFSVINTATNTVTDTVNIGGASQGVAVTPDGKKVYVTDPANNRIDVIDTATNNITATLNVNVWPIGVAVNPAGTKAYVTNLRSSTVSVVDIATNSFTAWVNVGYHPRGVTVTPDGAKVFVANTNNETVSVIDTATNTVINTVNVGVQPWGVAASPDGTKVYVTNYGSNNTSVIDTATNTVIDTVNVGTNPFGVAVTPDGSKVYVANNGDGTVSIINTTTNTITDTINVGGMPFAFGQFIGPNPAQQILPVANFTSNVTSGYASLSVQFTDKSTGSPTSWSWEFGDGQTSDVQSPEHTFSNEGVYTVNLTATNGDGSSNKKSMDITVNRLPTPPVADDFDRPEIQSVTLFPANTTAGSKIDISANIKDNTGVAKVMADNTPLMNVDGSWQGNITAPSSPGKYSLSIKANNAAGNTVDTSVPYNVVRRHGSVNIDILPTVSNVVAGEYTDLAIKVKNTQNIDDTFKVQISVNRLPAFYRAGTLWFDWTEKTVYLKANEEVLIPVEMKVPVGTVTGLKVLKASVNSKKFSVHGFDSGYIVISNPYKDLNKKAGHKGLWLGHKWIS